MTISKKSKAFQRHGNGNLANGGGKWIKQDKRKAIYQRDDLQCIYCQSQKSLTIDHLLPQQMGGNNNTKNLVTACKPCNSSKGSKTIRQYFYELRISGVETRYIGQRIRRNIKRKLKGISYRI
jgi:5-methylcytosine-specific restriction endonuclease McrA